MWTTVSIGSWQAMTADDGPGSRLVVSQLAIVEGHQFQAVSRHFSSFSWVYLGSLARSWRRFVTEPFWLFSTCASSVPRRSTSRNCRQALSCQFHGLHASNRGYRHA